MRKKPTISPPSKKKEKSLSNKDRLEKLRLNARQARELYQNRHSKYLKITEPLRIKAQQAQAEYLVEKSTLLLNEKFNRTVSEASTALGLDKKQIADAYKENKGQLVHKFKERNKTLDKANSRLSFSLGSFLAAGLVQLINIKEALPNADPDAFTGLMLILGGFSALSSLLDFSSAKLTKVELKNKIIEHNSLKQLPKPA